MKRAARTIAWMVLPVALGGCATAPGRNVDPLENVNRSIFAFNETVDSAVLKPVASGYEKVVPQIVRTGVDNVFGNIGDLWSAINHVLQAKPRDAVEMGFRFVVNTTFGIGGLFDIATDAGIDRRNEDFGQTLGRWGLGAGPYIVLPILGPSSLRDTAALPLDLRALPPALLDEPRDRYPASVLQLVSTRARLLSATRAIDDVALDKYVLIRDGYLARRRNQVYDGNPPEEPEEPDPEPAK